MMIKHATRKTFFVFLTVLFACSTQLKKSPDSDVSFSFTHDYVFGEQRPFPQCHASTLVRTSDNQFLVAWFGGTHEKHDDVGIWLSKGNLHHWSPPIEIAKIREEPHWNPVLMVTPSNDIILYFKVGRSIDTWETWYMTSHDNGLLWSDPRELVPGDKGGRGPVRNKIIVLSDGTWLAPASKETLGVWRAFVDRSEDDGKTWQATSFLTFKDSIPGEGVIQPTLWETSPGSVSMLLRSSAGVICRSDSRDGGESWSPVYKTEMPNPNSGIDLVKLDSGRLALLFNDDNRNWGSRRPLVLALSTDNGVTWKNKMTVETGVEGDEFSYPAIISYGDSVAFTYTWKRQRIAFWKGKIDSRP